MIKKRKKGGSGPAYNMAQNTAFMIKLAWTSKEKKVIVLSLLSALLAVASNLINLYISPAVLSAVERHVSMHKLLLTIAGFVFMLMIAKEGDDAHE